MISIASRVSQQGGHRQAGVMLSLQSWTGTCPSEMGLALATLATNLAYRLKPKSPLPLQKPAAHI